MPYSYFASLTEFYIFVLAFIAFIISEVVIKAYSETNRRRSNTKRKTSYVSSLYIVIAGLIVIGCIRLGFNTIFIGAISLRFPDFFYIIGIIFMLGGTALRGLAVLTLRQAFTIVVQTTDDQKLIRHGVYKLLRNPSYAGILLFVTGVAFSLQSVAAAILSVIYFTVFFGIRIRVEEKALWERFGQEFDEYCVNTWRLIPFIW